MKVKKVKLESLALPEKGAIISGPFGSNISSKFFVEIGVPVIRGNNLCLDYSKFNDSGFVFITQEKADELNCWADKEDLLFTAAGTLGQVGILKEPLNFTRYVISNKQIRVRLDITKVNPLYAYYWFSSPWMFKRIAGVNKGSTVPLLTLAEIRDLPIFLPENRSTQDAVVEVLESISNKIALNKKMNQKLEAMAKHLYDYWFVQFDFPDKNGRPYKTTGGAMTYNQTLKREIPTGWGVKNVNDVTTSVRGVSYSSDDERSKTDSNVVQILRGNNISGSRVVFDSNDVFVSSDLVAEEQKISKFDIVMTMSSGSKEHVGKSALALYDMPHSFGAFCSKFTPNEEARYFIDCYLHSEIFIKYIRQTCSGTGINNLTNGHFDKSLFAWPTEDILKAFNEKVSAIYEQRGVIEQEITRLTALRDKLLPLLMNGQVTII